ncbi:MAG: pilus assembly protein [Acidimicrobiia bacterium]|nr:pilus assembly protein [Acidimicrobiia bacterium]MDH3470577.1 pilus assembly protein [Acidimicrobiia bacterium]
MARYDKRDKEDGAVLVEFALVVGLLLLIVFGTIEMGLAFRDWLSMTSATREGVRVGTAAGTHMDADCFVLDALSGSLQAVPLDDIEQVWIFKADAFGAPAAFGTDMQVYQVAGDTPADLLTCNTGWDRLIATYPPAVRQVQSSDLDLFGVRIVFNHNWVTNIGPFGGTVEWTDDAVMRMEPKQF